ncbi:MAG: galactokinase, partial [candidate division KSB1 bacterium]|nr:galactokinase [candidate division KSB1 bacterium]
MKSIILKKFQAYFNDTPRIFAAPGRVNLIGEHTDYNDGFVFPMAIGYYTWAAASPTEDRKLYIRSENMNELIAVDLDHLKRRSHWSDYVAGVAWALEEEGIRLSGASILIESNVPVGAGLSSSAALEISSALALLSTVGAEMDPVRLALLGQKAENQFVGMNCGIMDQFISLFAQPNHALFIDCRTLEHKPAPLPSEKVQVVICNTMIKHELGASEYNKRRAQCEEGVRLMSKTFPGIKALRDVTSEQFSQVEADLPEETAKRCRHVISENERTAAAFEALQQGDLKAFGRLMNESHDSLRDDYEVSCPELDL